LAQALARLGAKVQISISAAKHGDIAAQLLQNAHESNADLLVMGGYGHSRLREAVLGGVTRSMLRQADIPVLLAH
jgi:nucleotide-binding universal stress UspA family protein